mmetsp:Transcript_29889/g.79549  ORF Transcript_29889/g.79549 Transcript_29889/m.79549 type:complete len:583 (-) Transcript_29889:223-1971(-)
MNSTIIRDANMGSEGLNVDALAFEWESNLKVMMESLDLLREKLKQQEQYVKYVRSYGAGGAAEETEREKEQDVNLPLSTIEGCHNNYNLTAEDTEAPTLDDNVAIASVKKAMSAAKLHEDTWPARFGGCGRWSEWILESARQGVMLLPCADSIPALVLSRSWEVVFGALIATNCAWIAYVVDSSLHTALDEFDGQSSGRSDDWTMVVDFVFLFLFSFELVVSFAAVAMSRNLRNQLRDALCLDFVVVFFGVFEAGFRIGGVSVPFFRYFRLLKVMRLALMCHAMRHLVLFRKLRLMMSALAHSVFDLLWASVILFSVSFVFTVLFLESFTWYVADTPSDDVVEDLRPFFSTFARGLLTCIMSVMGGVSWIEVVWPLTQVSWFLVVVFVFFIFMMILSALNVVTGLFVSDVVDRAAADQTAEGLREQLLRLFGHLDGNGTLNREEFQSLLVNEELQSAISGVGIDISDLDMLYGALDVDSTGDLRTEDFIRGCITFCGQSRQVDMGLFQSEMRKALAKLTSNFNQHIGQGMGGHALLHKSLQTLTSNVNEIRGKLCTEEVSKCPCAAPTDSTPKTTEVSYPIS